MKLSSVETPVLVLERRILVENLARMRQRARLLGVRLRPHLKTAKCAEVARLALGDVDDGITVSTLQEADYFADRGFRDILYAVALLPNKLAHAAKLIRRGVRLTLTLDTIAAADVLVAAARRENVRFEVLIEIDCDGYRSGVKPDAQLLTQIVARLASAPSVLLRGVLTHAGAAYACTTVDEITAMAEQERAAIVSAAETLRAHGLDCETVSLGSTPTAWYACSLQGVTELRAGVYMFNDLVIRELGVCRTGNIAVSVLCSVIGYQCGSGCLIVDAGWMALTQDSGAPQHAGRYGYGIVCDEQGRVLDGLVVTETNQEHGIVGRLDCSRIEPSAFNIGSRLRILPVHACATASQFHEYLVVEDSEDIITVWPRLSGR